jgi:Rod binding domain-containing protein
MRPVQTISPWDIAAQQAQAERLKVKGDTRAQLEHAARGFEAVLVRQWVELARKPLFDTNAGGAMAGYDKMVNDQLAFLVSQQGGIGFAEPMVKQMMRQIENRDQMALLEENSNVAQGASI